MFVYPCRTRADYFAVNDGPEFQRRYAFETHLARTNSRRRKFQLPGYCAVCDRPTGFLVDRVSANKVDGVWMPNWRERLLCLHCALNNRQRGMLWFIDRDLEARQRSAVYLMERLTPLYAACVARYTTHACEGSEYLGPDVPGGAHREGVRHENAESLSFEDGSIDVLVSNDVLEHVANPAVALREMFRVLASGGVLLMTIPFDATRDETRTRARIAQGEVEHVLPAEYHGNPVDPKGSLVFTDFGWDVLGQMRDVGFQEVEVRAHWSYFLGHLGGPLPVFRATKNS